jgi:hypothetical protein
VENSYCRVNGTGSSIQNVGNNRTLNLEVTFKTAFTGSLNVYVAAEDSAGACSGWKAVGSWTIPGANQPPTVVSMTPNSGTGTSQTFSFVTSDPNGAADLARTHISFNSTTNAAAYCYMVVSSTGVQILSDVTQTWLGPVAVGSASTVENSYCRVNGTGSSIQNVGNNRTLNLQVTFKAAFTGSLNVYVAAEDSAGLTSGWVRAGGWTIP